MNASQIKSLLVEELTKIAPEIDAETLDMQANIQYEYDIDSMDFLTFIIALNERTGVDIPEKDYGKIKSLNELISYLQEKI